MRRTLSIAALAVLALTGTLAFSSPSHAYVIDQDGAGHPLWWSTKKAIGYRLVAGNAPGGAAGENAVHRAFASWSNASANLDYRFEGHVSNGAQGHDGENLVYWIYGGWPYDPSLAAVTFRFYDTRNGQLVDADIVVNGERYQWSDNGSGYDIENSLTHEVGHFGGLGHSHDSNATMYGRTRARETSKRTLEHDDLAGLDAIYGGVGGFSQTGGRVASASASTDSVDGGGGGGGGGCAISPTGGARSRAEWIPILTLLALLQLRVLATRRSRARSRT